MNGKSALIWLGLAGVAGAVLFETSYEVQELEGSLASLNRRIVAEQEAIQVLRAEWSFLNDPTRLERLAAAHLQLRPADARQFVALEVVPMRPVPAMPETGVLPPMAGLRPIDPMPVPHTPASEAGTARVAASVAAPPAARAPESRQPEAKPAVSAPSRPVPTRAAPARTDDMGVLIARLGVNR